MKIRNNVLFFLNLLKEIFGNTYYLIYLQKEIRMIKKRKSDKLHNS